MEWWQALMVSILFAFTFVVLSIRIDYMERKIDKLERKLKERE